MQEGGEGKKGERGITGVNRVLIDPQTEAIIPAQ